MSFNPFPPFRITPQTLNDPRKRTPLMNPAVQPGPLDGWANVSAPLVADYEEGREVVTAREPRTCYVCARKRLEFRSARPLICTECRP